MTGAHAARWPEKRFTAVGPPYPQASRSFPRRSSRTRAPIRLLHPKRHTIARLQGTNSGAARSTIRPDRIGKLPADGNDLRTA